MSEAGSMAATDHLISGPFYHSTKADLKPGDLITPGHRSNYSHGKRTSPWVYMSATLSPWGAELAQGDGRGRLYIVEPTGPFVDDPDLTDKKFPGNPTKSYRSRDPLRVIGEVTDWEPHSPEAIQAMMDGQARLYALQAARVARIPREADVDLIHAQADALAREWELESAYLGCALLMRIRGSDTDVLFAMCYRSEARGETRIIELPFPINAGPDRPQRDVPLSGRITDVSAWHESWVAVIESCVTEIGLSLETRLWIEVNAKNDTLRFRVDADGPARSWQRNLHVVRGVLTDIEHGEIWDFKAVPGGG
jgi:rifampin ADP-ribosylating transferase